MMKKLKILAGIMIIGFALYTTGCGKGEKVKDTEQIIEDLNQSDLVVNEVNESEPFTVQEVTVNKRKTVDEEYDNVYCSIVFGNDDIQISKDIELNYSYYTEGGWILDNYLEAEDESVKPLKGVSDDAVNQAVVENGYVPAGLSENEHDTELEAGIDDVTVDISEDHTVYSMKGNVVARYVFSGRSWQLDSVTETDYDMVWNLKGTWCLKSESAGKYCLISFEGMKDGMLCADWSFYDQYDNDGSGFFTTHTNDALQIEESSSEADTYKVEDMCVEEATNSHLYGNKIFRFNSEQFMEFGTGSALYKYSDDHVSWDDYYEKELQKEGIVLGRNTEIIEVDASTKTVKTKTMDMETGEENEQVGGFNYITEGLYTCGSDYDVPTIQIVYLDMEDNCFDFWAELGEVRLAAGTATITSENTAEYIADSGTKIQFKFTDYAVLEVEVMDGEKNGLDKLNGIYADTSRLEVS